MYPLEAFERTGLGLAPVAAGRFVGDGQVSNWHLVPATTVLSCIVEGVAHERTEQGEFLAHPGELLCFRRGRWHSVSEHQGRPLTTLWLNLETRDDSAIPLLFGLQDDEILSESRDPQLLLSTFEEILQALNSGREYPAAHFLARLFKMAELCCPETRAGLPQDKASLTERAIRICRKESLGFPTVPELATRLGVCQNTLLNACRRELGVSAAQLLLSLKLERAKELLTSTRYKLSYIANACGFKSPSHFICCFREAEGVTPSAWRGANP